MTLEFAGKDGFTLTDAKIIAIILTALFVVLASLAYFRLQNQLDRIEKEIRRGQKAQTAQEQDEEGTRPATEARRP